MMSDEAVGAMIDALNIEGISFIIVGSLSSNYYGIPRSTKDADFVLELGERSILSLESSLVSGMRIDPQMTFETVTFTKKYEVTVENSAFTLELFLLSADLHDQERFARRVEADFLERKVSIPTAEDVIITKLRWYAGMRRAKDLDDSKNVVGVQTLGESSLDWNYIQGWCDLHGTRQFLDEMLASVWMTKEV